VKWRRVALSLVVDLDDDVCRWRIIQEFIYGGSPYAEKNRRRRSEDERKESKEVKGKKEKKEKKVKRMKRVEVEEGWEGRYNERNKVRCTQSCRKMKREEVVRKRRVKETKRKVVVVGH